MNILKGLVLSASIHFLFFIDFISFNILNDVDIEFNSSSRQIISYKKIVKKVEKIKRKKIEKSVIQDVSKSEVIKSGVRSEKLVINKVSPAYPRLSRVYQEEGVVKVEVNISENGVPKLVKIIESSGFKRLDQEAIAAAKKSSYNKALTGRKTILTFNFKLKD